MESLKDVIDLTRSNGRNKRISVLIADAHPIVRTGLREVFESESDLEVVGEACDGRQTVDKVSELSPDIVILDLRMPDMDGLDVIRALQNAGNHTKILVLTSSEDKNEYVQAMRLGCSGIVLKKTAPDVIVKSVRKVHEGEIWLDSRTTATIMQRFASPGDRNRAALSNREGEIVGLVAQGYRNKEMAEKLFISEQTVKNHLHNIFDKLGVSDRLELALYAVHNGIYVTAPPKNGTAK